MELLAGARIALTVRPVQRRAAALETAMLGHAPGRVRLTRLHALTAALEEMRAIGYGAQVEALVSGSMRDGAPLNERLAGLYHLPIPLHSSAEFHDIYPDAASTATGYLSLLAGNRAWLPQAVDDFFANGGEKLWVVRIPESEGQRGFIAPEESSLLDIDALHGLATLLVIPSLALVAFPDLERLQVPARLPDVPRVRLENPNPQFLPLGTNTDDDHRERRYSSELPEMPDPWPLENLLRAILPQLVRLRPDIQCLFTLPLAYSGELDRPVVDQAALARLELMVAETGNHEPLRRLQALFPYLRSPRLALHSPVGVIAGRQAAVAAIKGPWHSMAAQQLRSEALPYPHLSRAQTLKLREQPGIGVLVTHSHFDRRLVLSLDDERLLVPALPGDAFDSADDPRLNAFRAAEIMRFLGFLRRQLQALGEQLVFNVAVDDPRPRLLLERFFRQLYHRGALRGRVPEDGFSIRQSQPQEGALQFDIEIAPAFPIDRLFLTFINLDGEWQAELRNG